MELNISRREALRRGVTPKSVLMSLAMGPAITIATVLLAVHTSTSRARAAIPSSPPFSSLMRLLIKFKTKSIPPCSLTKVMMQATITEITVISYIE